MQWQLGMTEMCFISGQLTAVIYCLIVIAVIELELNFLFNRSSIYVDIHVYLKGVYFYPHDEFYGEVKWCLMFVLKLCLSMFVVVT